MNNNLGVKRNGLTLTWKIENFTFNNCLHGDFIKSPEFVMRINNSNTKWCLKIFPTRIKARIRYELVRVDQEEPEEISLNAMLSCITADESIQPAISIDQCDFTKASPLHEFLNESEWQSMLKKKSLYFPNNTFTIRFQMWSPSLLVIHPVEYSALTRLEVTKVSFQKHISDFTSLFTVPPMRWYPLPSCNIEITLLKKENSEYLSVIFCCKTTTIPVIHLNVKLSVINFRGIPLQEMENDHLFRRNANIWRFPDFVRVNTLTEGDLYFKEVLNLQFEFTIHMGKSSSEINETKNNKIISATESDFFAFESVCQELEALYTKKKYADVKIKSGNKIIPAHKIILHARSPVFAAMFDRDMKEKKSGVITINDVDPTTLDKLLLFMYSGTLRNLKEDMAINLLYAADKYEVLLLKEKCASFLEKIISVENACLFLTLGDSHNAESLKETAKEFICNHHHHFFSTDEWLHLVKNRGELANEIFQKLSIRYKMFDSILVN